MKAAAWILLIMSVLLVLVGGTMDTSVPTSMGRRVNNIGLMHEQSNIMTIGGVLFIASIIMLVVPRRKEKSTTPASPKDNELYQLCMMRDKDLLTDEEFSRAKERLLFKEEETK